MACALHRDGEIALRVTGEYNRRYREWGFRACGEEDSFMRACTIWIVVAGLIIPAIAAGDESLLTVRDRQFFDSEGREVILHGVNVHAACTRDDLKRIKTWGFNCVRLVMFWSALEPECGQYDDDYLRQIDERIRWTKQNRIYVLLDRHRDLWGEGVPHGRGAARWALITEGQSHKHVGPAWSDAYLSSPMVQAAFDSFWANKPGPDGVGIQDRFALAWQRLAERYAEEPTVIGIDLFNEPFAGSPTAEALELMGAKLGELFSTKDTPAGELDLSEMLADKSAVYHLYDRLRDIKAYTAFIEASERTFKQFERTKLNPMYQQVADAIRRVDKRHILFIEPSVSANIGITSDLQPLIGQDGKPDPRQSVIPHAYDLVTDAPGAGPPDVGRMRLVLTRLQEACPAHERADAVRRVGRV